MAYDSAWHFVHCTGTRAILPSRRSFKSAFANRLSVCTSVLQHGEAQAALQDLAESSVQ